jgi:hypothetical protein
MTELHHKLIERFGEHRVSTIVPIEGDLPLLMLDLEPIQGRSGQVTVVMTNGLCEYTMPVPEKLIDRAHNELFFCLPSYWEWEDMTNPNMNWVFSWIQRLANFVRDMQALSATMQQNHFFLSDPMLLEEELRPITLTDKTVHFLAIIPIFGDEMDYKQGKGTLKLTQKLVQHNVNEKLDDYRSTVLKSKWRFFKR